MSVHSATVWRVCKGYFRSEDDAQDSFQDTFLKYKAWLITVAANVCRDMLRARSRDERSLDEVPASMEALASHDALSQPDSRHREVLDAFHALDDPPRLPLYLAVYEGYTAPEIARMLDAPVNTVYSWISRGRKLLKEALS